MHPKDPQLVLCFYKEQHKLMMSIISSIPVLSRVPARISRMEAEARAMVEQLRGHPRNKLQKGR